MEWFWALVDRFQKTVAGAALQNFSVIDWIFLFAILWGLVQGGRKGFSGMFGKLLEMTLVSMLTISFYDQGARNFFSLFPTKLSHPVSYFLLGVFFWLSISWCINICGKFFKIEAQGLLKVIGGMIFGVLRMLLLLSFFAQFLLFLPIDSVQKSFQRGRTCTGYMIARLVPDLHALIMSPFIGKPAPQKAEEPVKTGG